MGRAKLHLPRRAFLTGAASLSGTLALSQETGLLDAGEVDTGSSETALRNISSFRMLDWRPYFDTSEDESIYKLYPTSVPMTADLTRKGRTKVVRKVVGPSWRPTPEMRKRNPEWPEFVGPGPDNPLGSHALYLSWTYYRIHGTHDTRKIGRRSSNGCIGLYNEQIAELYDLTKVGTQVLLI